MKGGCNLAAFFYHSVHTAKAESSAYTLRGSGGCEERSDRNGTKWNGKALLPFFPANLRQAGKMFPAFGRR